MTDKKYDLTYLSFGAGVQSTALLVCSNLGLHGVPRADVAIFADTTFEPSHVYQQLRDMRRWSKIPVETVKADPSKRVKRFIGIPVFTENGGATMRQCTNDWKVVPIQKRVRQSLCRGDKALAMIGISVDEAHRMKPSRKKWIDNSYPLIDARLRRADCLRIVAEAGLPKPERSACYFCPYHSNHEWRMYRDKHPKEFARAVAYDASLRDGTSPLRSPAFLHRTRVPLDQVLLDRPEKSMFPEEPDQFGNECEGMCGV